MEFNIHSDLLPGKGLFNCEKGLVDAHATSYNAHLPILFKPITLWVNIISQVVKIINFNSEALRNKYVNFENKKTLTITRCSVLLNPEEFVKLMVEEIKKNILDQDFIDWVMLPNLKEREKSVLLMMTMGCFKNYFNFVCSDCGIPKIKIEGSIEEWLNIKSRLYKLSEFSKLNYDCDKWIKELGLLIDNCIKCLKNDFDINYWKNYIIGYYPKGSGSIPYLKGHILCLNRFYYKYDFDTDKEILFENKSDKLYFRDIGEEKTNFNVKHNDLDVKFKAGNFVKKQNSDFSLPVEPDYEISF